MDELIENGIFAPIEAWLMQKLLRHLKRYKSLDALLQDQVGEPLNPKYCINDLTTKYSVTYKL